VTTHVGRSVARVEDDRLLRGAGRFVGDLEREGQVWARVVRSPVAHGRLVEIDAAAAVELDGVLAVVTAADLPDVRIPMRIAPTPEAEQALQPPLARDVVRYVGEPVAVVVAATEYGAEDAGDAVLVDVDPLEPLLDARAAASAPQALHPALGANAVNTLVAVYGEPVESVFEGADVVVRQTLHMHRHGAIPLETRGLLAEHDERTGRLTVWGPTKVKHFNRNALSEMLDLPLESIRFVEPDVGGSFGARGEFYPEDFLIPWLALRLGRPVKWIEDRTEHFQATNHSREQEAEMEVAASADGTLLAFRFRSWVNLGAYVRTQGMILPRLTVRHIAGPYRWRGFEAESVGVITNKTPAGTYRGPGQYEATYFRERALDAAAAELELDPAELRERNLVPAESMPFELDIRQSPPLIYDGGDYPLIWSRLTEHVSYADLRRETDARRAAGERVGIGLAAFVEEGGAGPWEQARVVPEPDGSFTAHVGVASVGQGVRTALGQVAADALGVTLERVTVSHHDTDVIPEGLGAFASRATTLGGNAVAGAVADLLDKARTAAAECLEVEPAELEVDGDGVRHHRVPGSAIPLHELGCVGELRFEKPLPSVSMGANLAVVSVDRDIGGVELERLVIAYDVGRAVNPRLVEGQLVGGAAQGAAGALLEHFAYDDEGQLLSTSFMDFAMPTSCELPPIEALVLELAGDTPSASNRLGFKGCGEGGVIGIGAAVANAVADAIGDARAVRALPLTPERVFDLMERWVPQGTAEILRSKG
jgi:carbon-monoxide dehydrogenase large subunit